MTAAQASRYACGFVRYIAIMAIEAVLHKVLQSPANERAELLERLLDSLGDDEVEISAEELAELDEAISDACHASSLGELIPVEAVFAQMRRIS
jgi:hypothetical protein